MRAVLLLGVTIGVVLAVASATANPTVWRAQGWTTDFSRAAVPLTEILAGGPPRDGIPPIDRPQFRPVREIKDIDSREPVIAFPLDERARAYPLRILMWHEIVNDTISGMPVAVTYCPLCNAALVFDRRVAGRVLDFGTSGMLRHSDLVMWDRQTETWWQQFSGEAIVGSYVGTTLKMLPSRLLSFAQFAAKWPEAPVLVPNNPGLRQYGRNPYVGYDESSNPMLFRGELPKGLPAMARVVVARTADGPVAVSMALLSERGRVAHQDIVFTWQSGQASALGHREIAKGKDVGNVEVMLADGEPVVHDITFAFVLHAFAKDVVVLTADGTVSLATGEKR